MLIAVFHSVVLAVTLVVLGAPMVAPLAVVVFLGSFIPVVGAFIGGGPAVLVAFASSGLTGALIVLGVLLIDNQVESHVLQPFLVGRYVRLHPFVVAAVITAGAILAGLPGALLAVPVTAAVYGAVQRIDLPLEPPGGRGRSRMHRLARRGWRRHAGGDGSTGISPVEVGHGHQAANRVNDEVS